MAKITHVIGPKFFGYAKAIADNLKAEYINELFSDHFVFKILIRLRFGYLFRYSQKKYYSLLINQLKTREKSCLLFVDIEFVPLFFLRELEINNIPYRIYFWDSLKNKPVFHKYLNHNKEYCSTFDYLDSIHYKIPLINLFAESTFFDLGLARNNKLVFIGTLHSIRPKIIKEFIDLGFDIDFDLSHFYYYNFILSSFRSLFNKDFRYFYLRNLIKYNSITKDEINIRFNKCEFVLDISHLGQSGLTSRTFEALSAGAFVLTNNNYSPNLLVEFSHRIIVYNSIDLLASVNPKSLIYMNSWEDYSNLGLDFFCNQLIMLYNEN